MSDNLGAGSQSFHGVVAADTVVTGTAIGRGYFTGATLSPAAAAASLTIFDGPSANAKILAVLVAPANGGSVSVDPTFPIPFAGGDGTQGMHYTLTGVGAVADIRFK